MSEHSTGTMGNSRGHSRQPFTLSEKHLIFLPSPFPFGGWCLLKWRTHIAIAKTVADVLGLGREARRAL
ncbi:MAG: hypothetical protein QXX87_06000, partial [Candidatus Jordarchaeales archaeon]